MRETLLLMMTEWRGALIFFPLMLFYVAPRFHIAAFATQDYDRKFPRSMSLLFSRLVGLYMFSAMAFSCYMAFRILALVRFLLETYPEAPAGLALAAFAVWWVLLFAYVRSYCRLMTRFPGSLRTTKRFLLLFLVLVPLYPLLCMSIAESMAGGVVSFGEYSRMDIIIPSAVTAVVTLGWLIFFSVSPLMKRGWVIIDSGYTVFPNEDDDEDEAPHEKKVEEARIG